MCLAECNKLIQADGGKGIHSIRSFDGNPLLEPGSLTQPLLEIAKDVNGQVFVVYGPVVTLMAAPTIEHQFDAGAQAWDPGNLSSELSDYFAGRDPKRTFSAVGLVD